MSTATPAAGDYDAYAGQYAAFVARREQDGPEADPYGLLCPLLDLIGDIAGRQVLDAGCGEGYLARALAARGAHVTGIDLSPRLIELARARDPAGNIDYQVGDLSQPRPAAVERFDAAGSYLVLNDVADYRGFAATLAASLKPGGGSRSRSTTPTAPSPIGTSPTTSTPARSAPTLSPTSSPGPTPTGQTRTSRPAADSPATCCWHSANPEDQNQSSRTVPCFAFTRRSTPVYRLTATPPHIAATALASSGVSGRHCWIGTTPGSTNSSPSKKPVTSARLR